MSATVATPSAELGERSWTHVLLGAVRREFRADVYIPELDDPVLFGPRCVVDGCVGRGHYMGAAALGPGEHLCEPHARQWRHAGRPEILGWVSGARPLRTQRAAVACAVGGCRRSVAQNGLCGTHLRRWRALGRPAAAEFAAVAGAAPTAGAACIVEGCPFPGPPGWRLCDAHHHSWRFLRTRHPEMDEAGYVAHLAAARQRSSPRYDVCGLAQPLRLELQLVLQARHDERTVSVDPAAFGALARWVGQAGVTSLLDGDDAWWQRSAAEHLTTRRRGPALALVRYARRTLGDLRDAAAGQLWELDVWPVARVDPDGRWAHQPVARISFVGIEPAWLRELAKRWARWRLSIQTKSPRSIVGVCGSLRRFTAWLESVDALPAGPGELTRELLERLLAWVAASDIGPARRRALIGDLKTVFDDVRMHGWAPGLPANAGYLRGEVPRSPRPLPRFIDEFVMAQLESDDSLARLPHETARTAILLLIECGLRSIDAVRVRFDPIICDQAGAPYLMFFNHKLSRDAVIPISERVLAQVRCQQRDVLARWPDGSCGWLLPRRRANPDGRHPISKNVIRDALTRWLTELDVRDATGRPTHVTPHQFRHTLGTRMVNNRVPLEIVQRMLDHSSPEMTARYATIKDDTLRREWERFSQRVNIHGQVIGLEGDGPLSDAAWAKENLARAKQTLPNGYCGLPLQQSCPHPNACLTCDHFLTTPEFLGQHREQLERTEQLIAQAQAESRQRLADMNEPVRANLIRVIEGLGALGEPDVA